MTLQVPITIKSQLPIGLLMRWGAHQFEGDPDSLYFKVKTASNRKHKVVIKLNSMDLYNITIGHTRTGQWIEDEKRGDIYAEDLGLAIDDMFQRFASN